MTTNDTFNEDKEHLGSDRERDYYENLTGTRGPGDGDSYGYKGQPEDTSPVELPEGPL